MQMTISTLLNLIQLCLSMKSSNLEWKSVVSLKNPFIKFLKKNDKKNKILYIYFVSPIYLNLLINKLILSAHEICV